MARCLSVRNSSFIIAASAVRKRLSMSGRVTHLKHKGGFEDPVHMRLPIVRLGQAGPAIRLPTLWITLLDRQRSQQPALGPRRQRNPKLLLQYCASPGDHNRRAARESAFNLRARKQRQSSLCNSQCFGKLSINPRRNSRCLKRLHPSFRRHGIGRQQFTSYAAS